MFSRGLLALQGPQASQALARLVPSVATMKFMTGAFVTIDGAQLLRHALGLYRRRRLRDLDAGRQGRADLRACCWPSRGQADRAGRARFAAPRSRPLPLRPRHRQTTTPVEAVLLWSIGKERRVQGGFPGAAVIQKQIAEGAPRMRVGLLPEGKAIAREGAEIAIGGRSRRQGHLRRLLADPRARRRHGLSSRRPVTPRPARTLSSSSAASPAGRGRAHALRPHIATTADRTTPMSRHALHQGSRMGRGRRRRRHRRHHRLRRRSSWATWCSSSAPGRRQDRQGRRRLAVVESVKAASDVYAPVSGEVIEANAALGDAPETVNAAPRAPAGSPSSSSPTPPRSTP